MTSGSVRCPFCGSDRTEPMSLFGQQVLTMQYYCNGCHTPFEKVKDDGAVDDFRRELEQPQSSQPPRRPEPNL